MRVPLADATLAVVPDGVSDEEGVLLGDILSTAFFCAEGGAIVEGESVVAVVGCGPVGLLAILAARHLGAARVFAVDAVPERLAMAASFGAEALDFSRQDVVAAVKAATDGRGADTVLEVVGASSALRLAFDLLRPMGTLSSVGVHTDLGFPFSPVNGYDKNLSYRWVWAGRCGCHPPASCWAPVAPYRPVVSSGQNEGAAWGCVIAVAPTTGNWVDGRAGFQAGRRGGGTRQVRRVVSCRSPALAPSPAGDSDAHPSLISTAAAGKSPYQCYDPRFSHAALPALCCCPHRPARSGRCPARHMMDRLVDLVQSRKYDFAAVITHRLPLSAGVEAYRMFDEKADGCVKVVLDPWT